MKIKSIYVIIFSLFSAIIFFNGCGKNKVVPDVCFKKNILPIFVSKCSTTGCHDGGSKRGRGNYSNYEGIMTGIVPYHPLQSEIYTNCRGKNPSMPPRQNPQLTSTELEYIKYWIHTGAQNSTDCGSSVCDTIDNSFSGKVLPIINTWCVGCHSTSNAGGGFDLSSYNGIKNAASTSNKLMGSLNQLSGFSAMPKGTSKLSDCDIRSIQKWIDAGMLNN